MVLGGTNIAPVKRHPTLGNNIVIGTGAKILGPVNIGDNVKIGANSVVVTDVPPNSVVVGVPGNIISRDGEKIEKIDLRHGDLPDPLTLTIKTLDKRIKELENRILDDKEKKKKKEDIEIYVSAFPSLLCNHFDRIFSFKLCSICKFASDCQCHVIELCALLIVCRFSHEIHYFRPVEFDH